MNKVKLLPCWLEVLNDEFDHPYMQQLRTFLRSELSSAKCIYPHQSLWFNAMNSTPLKKVKVVLLGQDPYHGVGQAHGLCFSVPEGVATPPSLRNIFIELQADLNCYYPNHGNLEQWAQQGVLLLNSILTVIAHEAGAHRGKGWEKFTDTIIECVSKHCSSVVFMLWGNYAQQKKHLIDSRKHLILTSTHPSPFSSHKGFLGCKHFSKANQWLAQQGKTAIDWQIKSIKTS